ncbi:MAG: CheY-like chemotaxis protein [Myxococcota bacterium]|jgi:CheY-like chemotaxis protein
MLIGVTIFAVVAGATALIAAATFRRHAQQAQLRTLQAEAVTSDVRARMEQQRQTSRLRDVDRLAMFDRINHDVRVPISALLGLTEILEDESLSDGHRELALDIRRCGQRAIERLADLCVLVDSAADPALDRPIGGDDSVELPSVRGAGPEVWTEFSAREMVDQVVDLARSEYRGTGLTIRFTVHSSVAARYQADIFRIRGVLSHLLADAAERTRVGNIDLGVTSSASELSFVLRDSGTSRAESFDLELAHRLARQLGTKLELSETRGIGGKAVFSARCHAINAAPVEAAPVEAAPVEAAPGAAGQEPPPMSNLFAHQLPEPQPSLTRSPEPAGVCTGLNILVVDDDATSRKTIGRLLERGGARVECASSGESALTLLRDDWSRFDALVCDVVMPGKNGIEVARQIRVERLSFPIVLLTSAVNASVRTAAAELHIDALLARPISSKGLLETLARSISSRAQTCRETTRGQRVLVVDDSAINRRIATEALTRRGYQVTVARDGAEGVQRHQSEQFDIILMDCRMPVMDGLEATRMIRESEGDGPAVPIIAVTASPHPGDRDKCRVAGMTGYVLKPVDFAGLVKLMAAQLPDLPAAVEESTPTRESHALVDETMISRVLEGPEDGEFIESLVVDIFETVEKWVPEMHSALAANDRELFVRRAHDLKSMTAMIGLSQFSTAYQTLEMTGEEGDPDRLAELLDSAHAAALANKEAALTAVARLSQKLWAGQAA